MKQKDILFLLVPIALFVIAWIGFSIYHNSATSTISGTLRTNILPITPDFDTKTISDLKKRERVDPVFEIQKAEIPTLSPTPAQDLIPSPTLSQPTATNSVSITP